MKLYVAHKHPKQSNQIAEVFIMMADSRFGASIFTSYAREDEDLKKELDKHLKVLKRSYKVQTWNDGELLPGQEWDQTIMSELNRRL